MLPSAWRLRAGWKWSVDAAGQRPETVKDAGVHQWGGGRGRSHGSHQRRSIESINAAEGGERAIQTVLGVLRLLKAANFLSRIFLQSFYFVFWNPIWVISLLRRYAQRNTVSFTLLKTNFVSVNFLLFGNRSSKQPQSAAVTQPDWLDVHLCLTFL